MKVRTLLTIASALLVVTPALASSEPKAAKLVLAEASKTAKAQNKNVIVIFSASWCGWCRKLEAFLEEPTTKKILSKQYVIVHLDVDENGPKKSLENAGASEVRDSLGGKEQGLPFYAIVDNGGKKLIDSKAVTTAGKPASNIGFPAEPAEIEHFLKMLKATAPKLSSSDLDTIKARLSKKA